jgi:hypothetical protein
MSRASRVVWIIRGAGCCLLVFSFAGCQEETGGDVPCGEGGEAARTAACVLDFSPGEDAGFGQERYPEIVYGEPVGKGLYAGSTDVLSLGKGGSIVLGFGSGEVVDGPGADFIVFENPFFQGMNPDKPFAELGEVSVSEDGETWATFPCQSEALPFEGCAGWRPVLAGSEPGISAFDPEEAGGDPFDLSVIGVARARYVKITDISGISGAPTAGFDLDAVAILHPAE